MIRKEKALKPRVVLFAASGTGGHLLPAVSIAEALVKLSTGYKPLFLGSGRPLEAKIVDSVGFERRTIKMVGVRRLGFRGWLRWLAALPSSFWSVFRLLWSERPALVVGVGGYVSVLPVIIARLLGIPTVIHEAEQEPGWANRCLSLFASEITAVHAGTRFPFGMRFHSVGAPLRGRFLELDYNTPTPEAPRRLLILGGSQGAESLDHACSELIGEFKAAGLEVFHQAREGNVNRLKELYAEAGVNAKVVSFVSDIAERYLWSDIIISRAGAGTVNEVAWSMRPAILVPLPKAVEQFDNAARLSQSSSARIVEEGDQFPERLAGKLRELCRPDIFAEAVRSNRISRESEVNASLRIAQLADGLLSVACSRSSTESGAETTTTHR